MPPDSTDPVRCPACGAELPALAPDEKRLACPSCTHVFAADDDAPLTGAHTPQAKRSVPPSRPPSR